MRRMTALVLVAAVACASTPRAEPPQESGADGDHILARAREERAAKLEETLAALSVDEHPADCPRACGLVAEICNLAKRICAIASRNPDDGELRIRCGAAEQRCDRSRERAAATCSCAEQ